MSAPTFTNTDALSIVLAADDEHYQPDVCYEFSNQRKFLSTDKSTSGIYKP
jgi:hypothetical protein